MSDDNKIPDAERTSERGPGEQLRPPDPQPEQHGDPNEPEVKPQGADSRCGVTGALGGCGCLAGILVALMLFGVIPWPWAAWQRDEDPADRSEIEDQQYPADEPGREAALAWAQGNHPDWGASVDDHSQDWTWVRLVVEGQDEDPAIWVELRWSAEGYRVLAEGPVERAGPTPGEQAAREATLRHIDAPDWVTRIESHSEDWTQASVSAGPPASEWVYVANLEWNEREGEYDLVSLDDVDYP